MLLLRPSFISAQILQICDAEMYHCPIDLYKLSQNLSGEILIQLSSLQKKRHDDPIV
jgi:hypothetical protein